MDGVEREELEQGMLLSRCALAACRLRAATEAALLHAGVPLTPQGLEVLRTLATRGGTTRACLGRLLGIRPQSLRLLLKTHEAQGWVERSSRRGQRMITCHITSHGLDVLRPALAAVAHAERRLFRGVGPSQRAMMISILTYGAESHEWDSLVHWHPLVALSRR